MTPCDFCDRHMASHVVEVAHLDEDGRPVCTTTMNRCDACRTRAADTGFRTCGGGAERCGGSAARIDEMTINQRLAYGAGIDGTGVV